MTCRRFTNETGTNMNNAQIKYIGIHVHRCIYNVHVYTRTHSTDDYIQIKFIATCTVTIPAIATPQLLTFDMASSGLLLTCTLGLHAHKHNPAQNSCHFWLSTPNTTPLLAATILHQVFVTCTSRGQRSLAVRIAK